MLTSCGIYTLAQAQVENQSIENITNERGTREPTIRMAVCRIMILITYLNLEQRHVSLCFLCFFLGTDDCKWYQVAYKPHSPQFIFEPKDLVTAYGANTVHSYF